MGYVWKIIFVIVLLGRGSHQVEQFICDNIGRIANPFDDSCGSYYVCSITPQGDLTQTEYTCPKGSIFSSEMKCCSDNHICPRSSESKHEVIEIEKSDNIHYQCQEDKAFQFECTMSGRYADLQGSNCSKYHTCSLLKNGSYMRGEFECPQGTNFDPTTQTCDEHYECPCTHNNGQMFLKFKRSVTELNTTPPPTIFCEPSEVEFSCDVRGRFPDRRDMSCSTYYHCDVDEDENLIKKHYRCPKCLSFDPFLGKCTNKFICPCSSTEATETTINTTHTTVDEFSRTTGRDFSVYSTTERHITSTSYSTINTELTGSTDNITYSTNQNDYETISVEPTMTTNSEVINDCEYSASDTPYICTSRGRFVDKSDLTCSSYFLCSALRNGTLVRTSYRCPLNSWFDTSLGRCSTLYVCPCSSTTGRNTETTPRSTQSEEEVSSMGTTRGGENTGQSSTASSQSTEETTTSSNTEEATSSASQEEMGSTRTTGTEIVTEQSTSSEEEISSIKTTSGGEITQKSSSASSQTNEETTTIREVSTSSTTEEETSSIGTTRTTATSSGFTQTEEETSALGTSTTAVNTDKAASGSSSANQGTTAIETTTSNSEASNDCDYSASDTPYICTSRGRFVDKSDLTCSSYFLCSPLRNGTLVRTSYRCPPNSWFDPSLGRCSTLYVCPCSSTTGRNTETTPRSTQSEEEVSSMGTTRGGETTGQSSTASSQSTEETTTSRNTEEATSSSSQEETSSTRTTGTEIVTEQTTSSEEEISSIRTTTGGEITQKSSSASSHTNGETTKNREISTSSTTEEETSSIGTTRTAANSSGFTQTEEETSSLGTSTTAVNTDKAASGSSSANEGTTSIETTTSKSEATNDCDYSASDTPYICTSRGRFVDKSDLTCSSYFLCSALRNGTLVRTSYRCPLNSWFDPSLGRCSTLYVCPCSSTTGRNTETTPRSTQSEEEVSSMGTTRGGETTEQSSTASSQSTEETTSRNTEEVTSSASQEETGSTRTTGTEIVTEQTTSSEEEISSIRTTTGGQITQKSSSASSQTNGETTTIREISTSSTTEEETSSIGTTRTAANSSGFTQKEEETSSVGTPTTAVNTDKVTSGSSSANEGTTSIETTTSKSEATNDCDYSASDTPYICTSRGRFVDKSDLTCSSYFLCSALRNGTLVRTSYRCPLNSWFDPSLGRCSTLYVCPCSSTTGRNTETTPRSTQSEEEVSSMGTTRGGETTGQSSTASSQSTEETTKSRNTEEATSSASQGETSSTRTTGTEIDTEQTTSSEEEISSIRTTTGGQITQKSSSASSQTNGETTTIRGISTSSITEEETSSIGTTRTAANSSGFTQTEEETSSLGTSTTAVNTDKAASGSSSANEGTTSIETTTSKSEATNDCDYSASDTPYICTSRGRFVDKSDLTCSSYFLCSPLRNGTLVRTSYRCPLNSWFDPSLGRCSTLYVCPCSSTTGRNTETIPRSTQSEEEVSSMGTTRGGENTGQSSTASSQSTEETTTSSNTEEATSSASQGETSSTRTTGTEIVTEQTTSSEEEISSIKTTSGGEITQKSSSASSQTNGETTTIREISTSSTTEEETSSIGTTRTAANSSGFTQKEEETSSGGISTTAVNTEKATSGSSSANEGTTSIGTTTSKSEATNDCDYSASDTPYICTSRGRFVDKSDLTCSSYFLCSALRNGTLVRTSYRCPLNSWFDPSLGRCSTLYVCPCSSTTERSESESSTSRSTFETSIQTSEEETIIMSTTGSNSFSTRENDGASSVGTTNPASSTELSTINPITTTEEFYECNSSVPLVRFICTTRGRFADRGDLTCSSYYHCSILADGRTVQTQYRCLDGSKFDPHIQQCSSEYKCPCEPILTPETKKPTSISPSTTSFCNPTNEEFVCATEGRFRNPRDLSCCTYYSCGVSRNNSLIQTEFTCPEGLKFDPDSRKCSIDYKCPCSVTEAPSEYTAAPVDCTIPTEDFVCTSSGRFPDRQDVSCCNYILCSKTTNGSFIKNIFSCPLGSTFNPVQEKCSYHYECPCIRTENALTDKITRTIDTTDDMPSTGAIVSGNEVMKGNISSVFRDCVPQQSSSSDFVCTVVGRFLNPRDPKCSSYIDCIADGTNIVKSITYCDEDKKFDYTLQKCTSNAVCKICSETI
ncbi:hypothetical protein WA026_009751 [Henosepilachna vigintioctopunctata]|uniref:Chitin-binding type-2 domain-containing protein n=1 Tax=Henosepilachna vigintioctopunctata TaxID=420089 RepID=A0AAW1TIZ2_9CUCU